MKLAGGIENPLNLLDSAPVFTGVTRRNDVERQSYSFCEFINWWSVE